MELPVCVFDVVELLVVVPVTDGVLVGVLDWVSVEEGEEEKGSEPLGVTELKGVGPMLDVDEEEGVGEALRVAEALGGKPHMRALSTVSAAVVKVPTATAVSRQHKLLAGSPSAAGGSTGVICPGKVVPRGVSVMTGPTFVKAPADPVVE